MFEVLLYEWHGCCITENPMEMSALTLINWKTLMMMIDSSVESNNVTVYMDIQLAFYQVNISN